MILLNSSFGSFLQLLGVLIIFIFVLGITYVTTKWIAGVQKVQMAGRNLNLIETIRIANNKYIQIVKSGEVYLVIAVGKDEITMLAKLTADQLLELPSQQKENPLVKDRGEFLGVQGTFQDILDKLKERFPKKQD